MKYYSTLIVALFCTTSIFAQVCPDSTKRYQFTYNGHTYYVVKQMEGFSEAINCAAELGGHLVYISNQAEQDTVYKAIAAAGVAANYTTVFDGGGIAYVWIGATDQQTEGTWRWGFNGTTFWMGEGSAGSGGGAPVSGAYHNWGGRSGGTPKEPDDYNNIQDGAAIGLASWPTGSPTPNGIAGEWNDINQANLIYFVVEVDSLTGVNAVGNNFTPQVYPNPAGDVINIALPQKGNTALTVSLVNLPGRTVKTITTTGGSISLSTSDVPAGSYILQVTHGEKVYREKVIIMH